MKNSWLNHEDTKYKLLVLWIFILHLTLNAVWIYQGNNFDGFDVMHHLNNHYSLYLAIDEILHGDQDSVEKLRQCSRLFAHRDGIPENWPRFVYVVGGFWNQVFGEMPEQTILSNSIFFLILLFSVYGIGKITGGPRTGVLAAALVSLYPNLVGLSRYYGLDFPLTAMVTAGVYALIKTDCWKSRKWSVIFAVISGLGILTKGQYVFFLCGPVLYVTWQCFRRDVHLEPCSAGEAPRPGITRIVPLLLNLTIVGLIILAITYFWWCDHISILYSDLVYHFGASYLPEGTVRPFASPPPFRVFTATWLAFYSFQTVFSISPVFFLLFVVNSGLLLFRKRHADQAPILWFWLVGSYIIFTLISSKIGRYFFPALPAVALLSALGFQYYSKRLKRLVVGAVIVFGIAQTVVLSFFHADSMYSRFYVDSMRALPGNDEGVGTLWVRAPETRNLPDIRQFAQIMKEQHPGPIMVGSFDRPGFFEGNAPYWMFYYLRQDLPDLRYHQDCPVDYKNYNRLRGTFDFLIVPGVPNDEWLSEFEKWFFPTTEEGHPSIAPWFQHEAAKHQYQNYEYLSSLELISANGSGWTDLFLLGQKTRGAGRYQESDRRRLSDSQDLGAIEGFENVHRGFLTALGSGPHDYLSIEDGSYSTVMNRDSDAELEFSDGWIHTTDNSNQLAKFEGDDFTAFERSDLEGLTYSHFYISPVVGTSFAVRTSGGAYAKFFVTSSTEDRVDFGFLWYD